MFNCKQKNGQLANDYYLEVKDMALDYNLAAMKEELMLGHLVVAGK